MIRTYERARRIDTQRSREAVEALVDLPIARYPTLALLDRAWALRHIFTGYDAMYLALAEALETSLVTADRRLASAVAAHTNISAILLV